MKRHICDVCKLKEITNTNNAIIEGNGDIDVFFIRDEFPNTPVRRRLRIIIHEVMQNYTKTNEDICESCLKAMLLEALNQ